MSIDRPLIPTSDLKVIAGLSITDLKRKRKSLGLSQQDIAELGPVTKNQIYRAENGQFCSIQILIGYATALIKKLNKNDNESASAGDHR